MGFRGLLGYCHVNNVDSGRAWHLLRHTFATRYIAAGGNVYWLSKLLGHKDVRTTEIYSHFAPKEDATLDII